MIKTRELRINIEPIEGFRKNVTKELNEIYKGKAAAFTEDSISFQSLDQFRRFLTPKRLELLRAIRKNKPKSIYALAKVLKRKPENVNTDINFLSQLGFIELSKNNGVRKNVVPHVSYDKMSFEISI
ncbi:hypothetical protein JXB31_04595 [Candidatus Woesearchaeota archaeon]|nr:hypothetical protein [Candidatus Woesearchaeota archaeon]